MWISNIIIIGAYILHHKKMVKEVLRRLWRTKSTGVPGKNKLIYKLDYRLNSQKTPYMKVNHKWKDSKSAMVSKLVYFVSNNCQLQYDEF